MKTLDRGQDKIQKISDELRREVLEPAHAEARKIIDDAKARASEIIADGEDQVNKLIAGAKASVEQERNVFQSSLIQASRQSLEGLRQDIEHKLFNEELDQALQKHTTDPKVIGSLITAVVHALEKEGTAVDLSVFVPKTVPAREVNQYLTDNILQKIKDKSVQVGNFTGGAQVKLTDKKLTIDISEEALKELVAQYVRKDFRKLIFGK
jgi:V/A-type H+/Na+-transporting ATPase subunit E